MRDIYETAVIHWHQSNNNVPKKNGWYLCKAYDLISVDTKTNTYKYGEPYYETFFWNGHYWDCDGVVCAWAVIPETKFSLEVIK